jgi:hypothetical protein
MFEHESETHVLIVKKLKEEILEHQEMELRMKKVMRVPRLYEEFRK